jgi:mRNA interferase RelE/StbE
MPGYYLLLSRQAHRYITGLSKQKAKRITQEIGDLRYYPFFTMHHDIAKLKGRKNYYRIRVGDLRIIFRVFEEEKEIYIEKIDHRSKIYK